MTVTQLHDHRRPRLRAMAVAAAGALALAGLGVVNAASASAETRSATAGSLDWGIKQSMLGYHLNHGGNTQTIEQEGATPSGTRTQGTKTYPASWNFPFVSGTYDTDTNALTMQYSGSVTMADSNPNPTMGPGQGGTSPSPFKYYKFANPKVVLDFAGGSKKLFVDMTTTPGGAATTTEMADLTVASPASPVADVLTYSNLAAAMTTAGAVPFTDPVLGPFYSAGTAMDPVSFTATAPEGGGDPEPTPTPEPGEGEQSITFTVPDTGQECLGEVLFSIKAGEDSLVEMSEAALDGDHLVSTGAIDPISVTDGRTGGASCFSAFGISGQVGDFTGNGGELPGNLLGWTPNVTGAGLTAGAPVASGFVTSGDMGPGLSTPSPLATADGAATPGADSGEAGADLELQAPVDSEPGSYQATLTITGMS